MKSVATIGQSIDYALQAGRCIGVDFVHDSFTVNKDLVKRICDLIRVRHPGLRWGCSSRTDTVTPQLLAKMRIAGCDRIFFGLETGSQRMQKIIGKNLNLANSFNTIKQAVEQGIGVTVSMIIGFPEETVSDIEQTINMAFRLRALGERIKSAQIHLLSPLAGTPYSEEYADCMRLDWFVSDIAPLKHYTYWEKEQISTHKELFQAFYYIENATVTRTTYKFVYWFLYYSEKFTILFALLFKFRGNSIGRDIVKYAETKNEAFFDGKEEIAYEYLLETMKAEIAKFINHIFDGEERECLIDVLAYESWKVAAARDTKVGPFYSFRKFMEAGPEAIPTHDPNGFVYYVDAANSKIKRLRLSPQLRECLLA